MRWWKKAPEAKASRTGPLIAFQRAGRPVWTPRNYAALARRGYEENAVAYRAVRMVAEAAASMAWILTEDGREASEHPLLELLRRPNPRQAGADLFEAAYGHLMLSGNAYLEAVFGADGEVAELYALRPDRMKVVPGADGWAAAYEYAVAGRTARFAAEGEGICPILHVTLFHPLDDHYGFAPLQAAQKALDIHAEAAAWNKALLDNAARPSGALVYEGPEHANLSEDQFRRLKAELAENFEGAANAGRPLLLEGGLSWQQMSLSPREMDFLELKNAAAREIALAVGVPPMLLGIPGDNTYSNYREANRALWRQTVLPMAGRMAAALTAWLAPAFRGRLALAQDVDSVEALTEERAARWKMVAEAPFLSDAEKREALGYGRQGGAESE
ncbi:phage portal protein [Afifella sp. IM 167]|uniref:phage portal protein n=1 Tax=Afifella sp. IM 167 TaxID=2033586 RepID=UPI001CC90A22|nr:phage portal protein [Afifella sp. IM 167]MBZ8135514.1 phage portal protein [Afifella sp. IM 167]